MSPTTNEHHGPLRGGSWHYNDKYWVRASTRDALSAHLTDPSLGVRFALPGRQPR